jgi:hypothetical protein
MVSLPSALQLTGSVQLGRNVSHPLSQLRIVPVLIGHLNALSGAGDGLFDRELPGKGAEGPDITVANVDKAGNCLSA